MKALIIDHDELNSQILSGKLEHLGHEVKQEKVKNDALELLAQHDDIQVVFVDPAPLKNARSLLLNIRRSLKNYVYIVLILGENADTELQNSGFNHIIRKPFENEKIEETLTSAMRLTSRIKELGDDSLDFPSAGGIISRSAFNQLFLAAIDRSDRYNEQSFTVFFKISNYPDLLEKDGQYYADYAVAKMAQHLALIRRQSDILGQISKYEYGLLLQRPHYETEPFDAANRFAEELSKLQTTRETVEKDPQIKVHLIELPSGRKVLEHDIILRG